MSCVTCFRSFLSFIIILNMIVGLAIIGTLLWLYLDGTELWVFLYGFNIGPIIAKINCFQYLLYSLLILGAIKVFMSFIGCCHVSRKLIFPVVLLFGIQVAGGVCVWYFQDGFTNNSMEELVNIIENKYQDDNATTEAFDLLQNRKSCCGSNNSTDWHKTHDNDPGKDFFRVPVSCCSKPSCNDDDRTINGTSNSAIFTEGCIMKVLDPIYNFIYRYEAIVILGTYILIEFIVMTLKVLACRKRNTDYEDSHMMELKPYR